VLEVDVRPAWPYRLPRRNGADGVTRRRGGVLSRLLHVGERAVVVHVWQPAVDVVRFRAAPLECGDAAAGGEQLELAIERMRFAVGVDEDLSEFYDFVRCDELVGPAVRQRPWHRPRRRPWPWEALAWAVTEQLIEASRAAQIQRRIVARWGRKQQPCAAWEGPGPLRDVPNADSIAACAPAELAAMDLSPARSLALIKCAREVAAGRARLGSAETDQRLRRISEIGPWTLQCLGFHGRGDPDSLPAGDLAYVKLVGHLTGLGRRATVEEVEEFFAPYEPFRGLAGSFALGYWAKQMGAGPPARLAA
jgi:3-methyladenine DNA glycosylase/8-oxoguanine DNA glycosylase